MPRFSHRVTAPEAGRTVKSIALKALCLSQGRFSSLKFSGGILLDGKPVHADARVAEGQELTAQWEDKAAAPGESFALPLSVPFMDTHYLIVDKPAPLPTLSSARKEGPALENALYAYLGKPRDYLFRPVNRLDKGTSGLLVVARSSHAQQLLQRQLHTDTFVREYRAVCLGRLPKEQGTIDLPLAKEPGSIRRVVRADGLRAVTHYWVEGEKGAMSLLRLRLETGRTHQIRAHLAALNCPILGDYLYGQACEELPGRFALHAWRVAFLHPLTGETVERESPLPPELQKLWEKA